MVRKRTQTLLLALVAVLVLSTALVMLASATSASPPAGFTGMNAVDLEVNSGYAWHTMSAEEATSYELATYTDSTVYVAGNSGRTMPTSGTVSNIAITVTSPGELTFEYALSAYVASDSATMQNDYLGWSIGSEITKNNTVDTIQCVAQGEKRPSGETWATYSISVAESAFAEQDEVTIYLAFKNMGWYDGDAHLNYAAIRNVTYTTGGRADVVKGYDTSMGTVSAQLVGDTLTGADLSDLAIGSTYRLTATANSGYQFYGWIKHSGDTAEYQTLAGGKLDVTVDQTTYYTPIFAATGTYVLRNGTTFYDSTTSLKTGIESAQSGDVLVLLKDVSISEDITVPAGVTFYVPFRAEWEKEEAGYYDSYGNYLLKYHFSDKDNKACHTAIAGENETYVRLTVNSGSTLTVNGEVVIGSVIGYASQRFQGHVSGAHGRITNNGTIAVNDGGILKCYGIVDGSGTTYINDGGILKESFIIGDFAGGSNTAELFFTSQMPFKRFSMQSVQCKLQMEADATLMAMMSVWASSAYNEAEVILVGDAAEAAFRPTSSIADTVALTRTYNAGKALTDGNGLLDVTGIGRTEWTFSNGLKFQPLTVSLGGITVDTGYSDFTIPYNFKINLVQGTYEIPLGMRIMPGAELTVESGATVYIGGRLMVLDGLVQTDMSTDRYPKRSELENAGFSGSGELTINGTLTMEKGSALGGLIKSDGGGKLVISEGVYLNNSADLTKLNQEIELNAHPFDQYTAEGGVAVRSFDNSIIRIENWVQQDGAVGAYDENTTWFNLPARILTADGVQQVQAGKTYVTEAQGGTAEYTVEYLYVEDGVFGHLGNSKYGYLTASGSREMTAATESLSRSVGALWVDSEASEETVEVTGITVAGSDKEGALTHNVTVVFDKSKSGVNTVLSNLTAVDATSGEAKSEKYVFLVKYTLEGNDAGITINPVDGVYTIPSEANGVLIEAALLGDLTEDGIINNRDLIRLRKCLADKSVVTQLGLLAADITEDGSWNNKDLIRFRKNYI